MEKGSLGSHGRDRGKDKLPAVTVFALLCSRIRRPVYFYLGRQVGRPMMMASGEHAALDLGNACDCLV